MTHADIITKFMIEYDKSNVTSSYPSLTKYEICTVLDKAYLALISQKTTGANFRKAAFEADVKAVEDMRPLIIRTALKRESKISGSAENEIQYSIPAGMLYFVALDIEIMRGKRSAAMLINHQIKDKFMVTDTNMPWIPNPAVLLEGGKMCVFYDKFAYNNFTELQKGGFGAVLTYIKLPNKFVDYISISNLVPFELNDQMAEELINLAIIMSLEIVESPRLNSKLQTSQLES